MMKTAIIATLALVSCLAVVEKEDTQLTSNSTVAFVRGEAVTTKDLKDESLTMLHKKWAKKHKGKDLSEGDARNAKETYYGQVKAHLSIRLGVYAKDFAKAIGVLAHGDLEKAKTCIQSHSTDSPPAWHHEMSDDEIKAFFKKNC
eukprot:CAMPEP_0197524530 /NCGR_PEP_ID=MMETSP1318-20131121/9179_1 /TAXON_ID=552666 /ORGANISM="Partenskyella glossopodia, Strain RCC365" /LENGTH=144 /DNA_ID=CAMNT_0043077505 /DNA_START=71 /DNA_END=505 /DNA_ORIENTATION=+